MSEASSDPNDGSDMTVKRNLPSWMSSKGKGNKSSKKKQVDACEDATDHVQGSGNNHSYEATQDNLSKLLEGVVFVLSGFVNPERSTLRSQALEMGAEYRPDWTSDCTLLVCAFPNTPKFRQVESDCGTIISKEWISECYNQKKLVDIERYFMHAGKPWRKNSRQLETNQDQQNILREEPQKQVERRPHVKLAEFAVPEGGLSKSLKDQFSPSKVKEWAIDDLNKTMSWLESQEEKPETNELKTIAAEGIITCLQDAIESLTQNHDVRVVVEQWKFVPRVIKELAGLEGGKNKKGSISKKELSELAVSCKKIYESEFERLDGSPIKNKKHKIDAHKEGNRVQNVSEDAGFDSDQTIEMTEEEIELACKQLSSEHCE